MFISTVVIAFGITMMLLAFTILQGFKTRIQEKIFNFGAHIQVTKYDLKKSQEESPLSTNTALFQKPEGVKGIEHIQVFSNKPGLLRTQEDIMGVIYKGVGKNFRVNAFEENLQEGRFINFPDSIYSSEIVISRHMANKLKLGIGDKVIIIFSNAKSDRPSYKPLKVAGIYQTGLEEFDKHIIIGDIRLNQFLNNWDDTLVGGYEIFIKDFERLDQVTEEVFEYMDYDMQIERITDKYIQIFDWMHLLDRNVAVLIGIMLFVVCFNITATLLIMIMERTNMIGILRALGASTGQVRRIFIFNGLNLILRGLLVGNLIGLGVGFLQYKLKIIPLDPENYYMDHVPVEFNWLFILGLNVLVLIIIALVLLIPAMFISRMKPIKSIRFS